MRVLAALAFIFLGGVAAYPSQKEPVRVACVGNSITYGTKVADREVNCYPARLQRMLGDGYTVANFGHPGATLLRRGHKPYVEQQEYADAIAFAPDIAIIHLGINDTDPRNWPRYNDTFIPDYLALIDSFRKVNPGVRILIARLTPLTARHPRFATGTRDWRLLEQKAIEDVARIAAVELIDFEEPLIDRQGLLPDAVHPDAKGQAYLARAVHQALTGDFGGLRMPLTFTDGMVLQRYKPLRLRARANAGDKVSLSIAGDTLRTVADNLGRWQVTLPPMTEASGLTLTVSTPDTTVTYRDVAVGEVWLASGQSNMAFRVEESVTAREDIAGAADSLLRFLDMKPRYRTDAVTWPREALDEVDDLNYYRPARWQRVSPDNAGSLSAVAYHFARVLRDSLDVPVGIISNAVGGSGAESWISVEALQQALPGALVNWQKNDYVQPWVQGRALQNVGGDLSRRHPYEPSYLFAAGMRPLQAYPVAGVIWYQGESNEQNVELHEQYFKTLVSDWRTHWGEPSLPFYFVQLAGISRPTWPEFRDSQRRLALEVPVTDFAVSMDYGDSLDVHPRNKRPIGERLARLALHGTYSFADIVPSGPRPLRAEPAGTGAVMVTFDRADGLTTVDGRAPAIFELAAHDGLYLPAVAEIINGNQIKVSNMQILNPRFVRYAWQPYNHANLINADSLPASTFKLEVSGPLTQEEGYEAGVSAQGSGIVGSRIVSAGGCNFPANPLAAASKKKHYRGVYAREESAEGGWVPVGELPEAMAYAACATAPQGLVMAGGAGDSGSLRTVILISAGPDGRVTVTSLPALPATLDNASAATIGSRVYVAGGNYGGSPSNALLCLDLENLGAGWQTLLSFPGNPRVQPVLASGKDSKGEECLWLFGGFAGKSEGRDATLETGGLVYTPSKRRWSTVAGPVDERGECLSVAGGCAATLPDGRIVVTGGVNKDVFIAALRNQAPDYLTHPVEWYRFNDRILIFDPSRREWSIAGRDASTARAGASAVAAPDGSVTIIGGELKPRIRTPKVTVIHPAVK